MQHFQQIMLYYSKKCKDATETQKICAVQAEGAVTDRMCQKWFVTFRAGDFSLRNAPRSVEIDSDEIKTLIENNQRQTTQETANIRKISKSIKVLVKIKNVSFILQKKNIHTFQATQ